MVEQSVKTRNEVLQNVAKFFGELFGTAILVYVGCLGCTHSPSISNSAFQASFAFGLAVLIAIQCFGCVSGAHINPAVTLASLVYEQITWFMAIYYVVAQILGGLIGYGLLIASLPKNMLTNEMTPRGACVTFVVSNLPYWQGFLIEFLITAVLICVCCGIWDQRNAEQKDSIPIRFGLTVGCIAIAGAQYTGASMNPARSLAPAVWNNSWEHHWIYWVAPLVASLITSLAYKYGFRNTPERPSKVNISQP
ncbi:aquaporin isoform X5 [Drosophila mojavensis]|uniref:Uncharacterized protein, isoform B n=1 Tax=Drosophila mojavensis TaxID=7230 RepID=A0A0Q9XJZ0_DROMO|nr:aquaporin isoform X5 [Drosophila mojavensis]KRG04673.1 uncharacterized protein Dmoj_GI20506, isoform B [Drosophila mojavensis]